MVEINENEIDTKKAYFHNYYETNKMKYWDTSIKKYCDICKRDVIKLNFSKHLKTYKHKLNEKLQEKNNTDDKVLEYLKIHGSKKQLKELLFNM